MSKQSIFVEVSGDDSIDTETTADSEHDSDEEFPVERILAEKHKRDGATFYLIKWESYPLHRASWEEAENIVHDGTLQEWADLKEQVAKGNAKPFNVDDWQAAVQKEYEEKDRRQRLRIQKRRERHGSAVALESDDGSGSSDALPTTQAPKRTRVNTSPVKRKGVARTVNKPRKRPTVIDDENEDESEDQDESDLDSLFAEPKRPPAASKQTQTASKKSLQSGSHKPSTSKVQPPKKPVTAATTTHHPAPTPSAAPTAPKTAARKSAPSDVPTAKRSRNIFASDWTKPEIRKERARVSCETPKNSTELKFRNLSTQNRYQKYSKNEPAPDPDALAMFDPKTGRIQPPKAAPSKHPKEIHQVYGRRTPPPAPRVKSRSRSHSPDQTLRNTGEPRGERPGDGVATVPPTDQIHGSALLQQALNTSDIRRLTTCHYWKMGICNKPQGTCPYLHAYGVEKTCFYWKNNGRCNKPEGQCKFAHWDTGVYAAGPSGNPHSVDPITCFYWKNNGKCNKESGQCRFAHWDTGVYAPPPGTYTKAIKESDIELARRGSVAQERAMVSPAEQLNFQPMQIDTEVTQALPEHVNAFVTQRLVQPYGERSPSADPRRRSRSSLQTDNGTFVQSPTEHTLPTTPADPRLRSRLSLQTDNGTFIQSPIETTLQIAAPGPTPDAVVERSMQDTDDAILGTYEEDRKMAKRYVSKLDLTPLLKIKDGEMIKNVFLQIPKSRSHEMAPLRKKLEDFKCVVYISRVEGHWDFFRKNFSTTQCLIVVHPSEMYLGTMPGLFNRLNKGSTVRVFSVGVQHQRCIEEDREPAYEALRLFPLGGITFIADDVFAYYPEMALQIIEDFLEKLKNKPIGGEHSKIGARPGVKDWLERLALQKYHEQECGDEDKDLRWIKCYDAICRLCPVEDEDPHFLPDRSVPLEHSFLWSINEDELPSFKGRWESGDEEGATDYMVELFAGEACISAWKYRRFIVVYQRPDDEKTVLDPQGVQVVQPDVDPRGWREKYCHIGVLTPEQCLSAQTAKK